MPHTQDTHTRHITTDCLSTAALGLLYTEIQNAEYSVPCATHELLLS